MRNFSSRVHQKLMAESEYALKDAAESSSERVARIVNDILHDSTKYRLWEAHHAGLLLPVAEHVNRKRQILALRQAEVQLVHRRALFKYLREKQVFGETRRRIFRLYHRTRDYHEAVMAEHRQYTLAVSSHVSADHLIDVMSDPIGSGLLDMYETSYTRYFEMQCYVACAQNSHCVEYVRSTMSDAHDQLLRLRHRIDSEPPVGDGGSFERQAALAQSGRYPILNYMVG